MTTDGPPVTASVPGPGGTDGGLSDEQKATVRRAAEAVVGTAASYAVMEALKLLGYDSWTTEVSGGALGSAVEREQRLRQALGEAVDRLTEIGRVYGEVWNGYMPAPGGWNAIERQLRGPAPEGELVAPRLAALLAAPDDGGEPG